MSEPDPNLKTHTLLSLVEEGPPVGVNLTLPAFQTVYINAPVHDWRVRKVEGSKNRYRLSVGGYPYVGVLDDKVTASIHPEHDREWTFHWSEFQSGFAIELVPEEPGIPVGWTVSDNGQIVVSVIIVGTSEPPTYRTSQLFRWKGLVGAAPE